MVRDIWRTTSTGGRRHLPFVRRNKLRNGLETFGCRYCWPSGAAAAWNARHLLEKEVDLIDELHFHVMILTCLRCRQGYVSVFTEIIDLKAGDDSQYWSLIPITVEERGNLSARVSEAELERLGLRKRCLVRDHPTGERARTYWAKGFFVGRHD
jgi:hypothetical protein